MDNKVELGIISVAGTPNNNRIYALIMGERKGERYFPIIISEAEAQSIIVQIQKINVVRPTSHDVFADYIKRTGHYVREVFIFNVINGVFYSHIIFDDDVVVESRAVDGIALAIRFSCPIFTLESILESENIVPVVKKTIKLSLKEELLNLNKQLEEAVEKEDYEKAAKIRDVIKDLSQEK